MTDPGKSSKFPRPHVATRRNLVWATLGGALPGVTLAGLTFLTATPSDGWDVLAGTMVVALPNLWFVLRATRTAAIGPAAVLAAGKFALVTAGFALWFALRGDANLVATLVGTTTTLVLTTFTFYWSQRWTGRH